MGTIKEASVEARASDGDEGSGVRTKFWMKTFDMLADHPLGMGSRGYEAMSPYYLPEQWLTKGRRAVHSTWFEVMADFGYHGFVFYVLYILACFWELRRVRKSWGKGSGDFRLFQSFAMESSLVGFIVPSTFVGMFFVEFSYWPMMFIACFFNLSYLKKQDGSRGGSLPSAAVNAGHIT